MTARGPSPRSPSLPPHRSFDQSFAQAALVPQAPLDAQHPSVVAVVIVPEQVQQPVQRKDTQLGELRVARLRNAREPPRDAARRHTTAPLVHDEHAQPALLTGRHGQRPDRFAPR